jgi:hypothetical protein
VDLDLLVASMRPTEMPLADRALSQSKSGRIVSTRDAT